MSTSSTDLLTTLTESLTSTLTSLPSPASSASILPPKNGISLLDVKNDVLLSYLHNLVFLSLLRLKSGPIADHAVISDLVKLRLLLERGVKPLEQKLKYQIDKVVVAAASAEGAATKNDDDTDSSGNDSEDDISGSDAEPEDGDEAARKKTHLSAAAAESATPSDLAHRPNPSSLLLARSKKSTTTSSVAKESTGVYRPPRIAATSMPEVTTSSSSRETKERAPVRNHALEDFISDSLSSAPVAVPSIGTTIVQHGRGHKTNRDRKVEMERQEFEEANLVRLPKMSKKEAQAARKQNRGARENAFGGEDWRSFAGDLDRLAKSAGKSGRGEKVLERSRKRGSGGDGDEGEGRGIGKHYEGKKGLVNKRRRV
ncbi:Sas10/Utp3/C1D family-domain-containing protein [Trichophaea hybrida]|nr:Sas10/Utp3/C1D family-domain-containing protein [Trichophaea hybrida]